LVNGKKTVCKNLKHLYKKLMRVIRLFILVYPLIYIGCRDKYLDEISQINPQNIKFEILQESRQIILKQEHPWEDHLLGYFNVIKKDSIWRMWYTSWGKKTNNDIFGACCFAYSRDGEKWEKSYPDSISNNNIFMSSQTNNGICEQFVFYDYDLNEFILVANTHSENKILQTYIWKSKNGINWNEKKLLFPTYLDTQFSILKKGNLYNIYCRDWTKFRIIGKFVIDKNGNSVETLKSMLSSQDINYNHLYNNAASLIDNKLVIFPTLYNQDNDKMYISIGFETDKDIKLTYIDITNDLFGEEDIKWALVSPGLIPTAEKNVYWMYYLGDKYSHYERIRRSDNVTKYYRIKIKIET
jgi:hypothetical protein